MAYPDFTRDPNDSDVQAFLTGAGIWSATFSAAIVGMAAASLSRFKELTGRYALISQASTTLFFDPPGDTSNALQYPWKGGEKRLELPVPFTAVTAVTIGCQSADVTTGSPAVIGQNVYLKPRQYAFRPFPIEWLEFTFPVWGGNDSIGVTGTPGSWAAYPEDAWLAIVKGAAAMAWGVYSAALSGGAKSLKDDDESVDFGTGGMFSEQADMWRAEFDKAVQRHKFVRVGL